MRGNDLTLFPPPLAPWLSVWPRRLSFWRHFAVGIVWRMLTNIQEDVTISVAIVAIIRTCSAFFSKVSAALEDDAEAENFGAGMMLRTFSPAAGRTTSLTLLPVSSSSVTEACRAPQCYELSYPTNKFYSMCPFVCIGNRRVNAKLCITVDTPSEKPRSGCSISDGSALNFCD